MEDYADCLKALFPWAGFLTEFDNSGCHTKHKVDALEASKMGKEFGGAWSFKRPSVITIGCLGPYPATRIADGEEIDVKLKEGDVQVTGCILGLIFVFPAPVLPHRHPTHAEHGIPSDGSAPALRAEHAA